MTPATTRLVTSGFAAVIACAALAAADLAAQVPAAEGAPLTLSEAEALALQHNPTLGAAAAGLDAARGRQRQAGAWPNPVIGYAGDELSGGGQRGVHGFFVEGTVPLGGKLARAQDVAAAAVERAAALGELQRLRVVMSVRQAYYRVLLSERRVAVRERLALLASEAVGVTAQLFNVGAADRPDFLEMEIEAGRAQLALTRARNDVHAARLQLAAVAGVPAIASRPLAETADSALPELERDTVVRDLLARSPELRAARAAVAQAQASLALARSATSPDLVLRGGAGYNREREERTSFGRVGWEASVEAGVSVPLFNRNRGAIAAAQANEGFAAAEVRRLELSLQARAAAAFASYLSALRAAESYRDEMVPRAEEAYRLYLGRYREMAAAYPQVLVSQRTLVELSQEYLESLEEAWAAALQIQGLLAGGGLDAPGSVEAAPEGAGAGGQR